MRHSVSSQKAYRSASEPPPRATITTSTSGVAASSRSAAAIRGAAWRSWTGTNAHTSRPDHPRRRQAGEDVVARLAALGADDADRPWQRGAHEALLGLEDPLGVQPAAQPLERQQQVALAGDPQLVDGEVNDGEEVELPG